MRSTSIWLRGLNEIVLVLIYAAHINDLGFFHALQSAYEAFSPRNAEEIIHYVQRAYQEYLRKKINRIWLSLIMVMNEIIDCHGQNDYVLPHMNKDRLARE